MDKRCRSRQGRLARSLACLVSAVLCALLALPAPAARAEELSWVGCDVTTRAFMTEIARAYEQKTGVRIRLTEGGAARGIRAVSAEASDVGGTCRHWLLDKQGRKIPEEANTVLVQVAWDAVVVIVNPKNPLTSIRLDALKGVFSGKVVSWRELGWGLDKPVAPITRMGKDSGVDFMFRVLVFGDPDYDFLARSLKVKSSGQLERKVEQTATAMGVDGVSSARRSKVKILALDGVHPTKENVASGAYPLYRPLYLVLRPDAGPKVKGLADFMLGPEGQAIVSKTGAVNLEEGKRLAPLWEEKKRRLGL